MSTFTLLFAPVVALMFTVASAWADCTKFKPDGTVEKCEPIAQQRSMSPEAIEARCNMGGLVAHKAYMEGTYDAQRPNYETLDYLVDYWADMLVVDSDREMAHRAVKYIADKMATTGLRRPDAGVVYEITREFMVKECL